MSINNNKLSVPLLSNASQQHVHLSEHDDDKHDFQVNSSTTIIHDDMVLQHNINNLLRTYADVFDGNISADSSILPPHVIDTGGVQPVHSRQYRLSLKEEQIVRDEINKMMANGIIEPSNSPWSSQIVLVDKADGSTRFCINFRKLNSVTVRDSYPLPLVDQLLDRVASRDASVFSILDLKSGFHQIPMNPNDKPKTAFGYPGVGHFQFRRMPFGLNNATSTFQRTMDVVLGKLLFDCAAVYVDDVVVYSKDLQTHVADLEKVFKQLQLFGLRCNQKKCVFGAKQLRYLGYIISKDGIKPDTEKSRALMEFPQPSTPKSVSSFLGLASYFRRFIPNYASTAKSLYALTTVTPTEFVWMPDHQSAFDTIKHHLSTAPLLTRFDPTRKTILTVDASKAGVGSVLMQKDDSGQEFIIGFSSKQFSATQSRWATQELEGYAVFYALQHWRVYLHGIKFTLLTDHANLIWILQQEKPSKIQRWSTLIQEFNFDIIHTPGRLNVVADALSRHPIPTTETETDAVSVSTADSIHTDVHLVDPIQLQEIQKQQQQDPLLQQYIRVLRKEPTTLPPSTVTMIQSWFRLSSDGTLLRSLIVKDQFQNFVTDLIVVPESLTSTIIASVHDAEHTGVDRTFRALKKLFWWPNMRKSIKRHVRSCITCATNKSSHHHRQHGLLQPIVPTRPNEIWNIDIFGPIDQSKSGCSYIMTMIDHFSHWIELVPLPDISAATTAEAFVSRIIHRHGLPELLITDRGSNFISELFRQVNKTLGIRHSLTSALHPQANGCVEHTNKAVAEWLKALSKDELDCWDEQITALEFSLRTRVSTVTGFSPYFLQHGHDPIMPHLQNLASISKSNQLQQQHVLRLIYHQQHVINTARNNIRAAAISMKERYDTKHNDVDLPIFSLCMLYWPRYLPGKSHKAQAHWIGPFRIISQPDKLHVEILNLTTHKRYVVHVQRVKPFDVRFDATLHYRDPDDTDQLRDSPHQQPQQHDDEPDQDNNSSTPQPSSSSSLDHKHQQQQPAAADDNDEPLPPDHYEIEKIVDHRLRQGVSQYKIRWRGFPASDDSWVNESDLDVDADVLTRWLQRIPKKNQRKTRARSKSASASSSEEEV
jgi:putative transposase